MNRSKPKNFGQRMQELKKKKAKDAETKELLERYPAPPPLDAKIETHISLPLDVTAQVERRDVIINTQTPLERAIQTLREKSQGL